MTTDLALTRRAFGDQSSDRQYVDFRAYRGDLVLASVRANLTQAILNRLFTRQGALTGLGHPDYGSRLYQLIGEPNTQRTRILAEMYIRESLAGEPRIAEIVALTFEPFSMRADKRFILEVNLVIRPVDDEPLTITVGLNL